MTTLMSVATIGLIVLIGLAAVVGRLDGRANRDAWAAVAGKRRALAEWERSLAEHRDELVEWEGALAEENERRRRQM